VATSAPSTGLDRQTAFRIAAARERKRRNEGRASLAGYVNAIDIPGKPASDDEDEWLFHPVETAVAAHHLMILKTIERARARPYGRYMIFMPPGSAKSTYASVVAPTYFMGRTPGTKIILASYATPLARKMGRRARQIVKSDKFETLFGCTISPESQAAHEWALTNGSEYLAGGLLSGLTGNRAGMAQVDDPIKGREQADSPVIRDKTWDAYNEDLQTRLIPGGTMGIIQTRWHENDLAGRLLPKGYKGESGLIECTDGRVWEIINLPAQCERDDDPLGRKIGEMLWPEWFDESHWAAFRAQARTWAALFQQRPRPDEGGIFKQAWCDMDGRRFVAIPVEAKTCVHSWDTAQKEKDINDPSVCTVWQSGRGAPGHYLRDVFRDRIDYPKLKHRVIVMAERDNPSAILIEDKSSGQSLIQELRTSTTLPIVAIEPEGNKVFRAQDVSPMVESGLLHLPHAGVKLFDQKGREFMAPWLADFEGEFFGFPLSTHADQVDSVSQYLKWAREQGGSLQSVPAGMTRTVAGDVVQIEESHEGFGSVGLGESMDGF
jgi:predicted phage terminase large subunit-like protein